MNAVPSENFRSCEPLAEVAVVALPLRAPVKVVADIDVAVIDDADTPPALPN
jgi:hypothetical protein